MRKSNLAIVAIFCWLLPGCIRSGFSSGNQVETGPQDGAVADALALDHLTNDDSSGLNDSPRAKEVGVADRGVADGGPVDSTVDIGSYDAGPTCPPVAAMSTDLAPSTSPSDRVAVGTVEVGGGSDRLWIYGGGLSYAVSGLYYYDTADSNWTRVPSGDAEGGRMGHMMGWEPRCKKLVIFGGRPSDPQIDYDDIRIFDPTGGTWSSPTLSGGKPPGRSFGFFSWVPHKNEFLLVGGKNGTATTQFGDIWTLRFDATCSVATWTEQTSKQSGDIPTPRGGVCGAYDGVNRRFLGFGGEVSKGVSGAGLYELNVDSYRWREIIATGEAPTKRAFCTTTYHAHAQALLIDGGQSAFLYEPATQNWTKIQASAATASLGVYSPHLRAAIYFGGYVDLFGSIVYLGDTSRVDLLCRL